ncbi:hypothetical protein Tco_0818309 [Tanacetum coccineum]
MLSLTSMEVLEGISISTWYTFKGLTRDTQSLLHEDLYWEYRCLDKWNNDDGELWVDLAWIQDDYGLESVGIVYLDRGSSDEGAGSRLAWPSSHSDGLQQAFNCPAGHPADRLAGPVVFGILFSP